MRACARACVGRSSLVQVSGTTESIFIGVWKRGEFTLRGAPLSALFKTLQSMKLLLRLSVFTHFISSPLQARRAASQGAAAPARSLSLCAETQRRGPGRVHVSSPKRAEEAFFLKTKPSSNKLRLYFKNIQKKPGKHL